MRTDRLIGAIAAFLLSCSAVGQTLPPCVHVENSHLIFPGSRTAQDAFYAKLDSLMATRSGNVNIWHVGGSHVQAAYFPNRIMDDLDSLVGLRGDRGFLFPSRLATTNSDKSYRISTTGSWEAPMLTKSSKLEKPRYGITGFGARTSAPDASVSFNVSPRGDSLWSFRSLRVLGYASSDSVRLYAMNGADMLNCRRDSLAGAYIFDFPSATDSVSIDFCIPEGETFVLNGLQPLSGRPGINYFASGVNGAMTSTWADQCVDLARDLELVHPDLVILGLGINDSACKASSFSPDKFKNSYRRLISIIRSVSPDCAMIFITNNDSYRYVSKGMTYNENAPAVRKAMMELAEEYGAGVWDLFGVMGGCQTITQWRDAGLAKPDRLHFTDEGYILLADLFVSAMQDDRVKMQEDCDTRTDSYKLAGIDKSSDCELTE